MPPTIGAEMRLITSEPVPWPQKIGGKPAIITTPWRMAHSGNPSLPPQHCHLKRRPDRVYFPRNLSWSDVCATRLS